MRRIRTTAAGVLTLMVLAGSVRHAAAQEPFLGEIRFVAFTFAPRGWADCNGQTLFWVQNSKLQTKIGPGVQGHAGQFLAMLAQSRVRTDYPMKVDNVDFKVADLVEHEKHTCQPRTELTFKLIALVHYLIAVLVVFFF